MYVIYTRLHPIHVYACSSCCMYACAMVLDPGPIWPYIHVLGGNSLLLAPLNYGFLVYRYEGIHGGWPPRRKNILFSFSA